jgi:hypothetical protein
MNSPTRRRAVLFGAPLLGYVVAMLHPTHLRIGESPWLYIGIHLFMPVLVGLLAWMILLLVGGVESRAAMVARLLVVPFALVYIVFSTFAGLAYGVMVWRANRLPAAEQAGAVTLIHEVFHNGIKSAIYVVAAVLWVAAVLAAAVALRHQAPVAALVLLVAGAVVFGYSHERPWGPAGMAAILAGVAWLELKPKRAAESRLVKPIRSGR